MYIAPMLLSKRENPFDDERYIYEPKIDGHRLILSMEDGAVQLFTRHHNEVTLQYPELHQVPIEDNSDVVLDGEVACLNPDTGTIEFEMVMERFMTKKSKAIADAVKRQPVVYFVFDILRYKGKDLRSRPLMERKLLLSQVLTENNNFSRVIHIEGSGVSMFSAVKEKQLEGIVAKRKSSKYFSRRVPSWIKVINYSTAIVQIAGYRKEKFGWLLKHDNRYVGVLEFAVPAAHKKAFYGVSKSLITGEDKNFVYIDPRLSARVRFRNWTRNGMLRTPEFVEFVV